MAKLKTPIQFETTFSVYTATDILGEGGSGRVYAAQASDGTAVAVKLLSEERASRDKRSRFKNEIGFLARNRHSNIVAVTDHGLLSSKNASGPFYVMARYDGSLRELIAEGIPPEQVLPLFSQLLDGVEAAHLQGVVHRDLKPENVLLDRKASRLAVADFGVARFTEDLLVTNVETAPAQRLANFQYAAPEQRVPGKPITSAADLYALGLMLNEMFTGVVPHGTGYKTIASAAPKFAYLDQAVADLMRQNPVDRPPSIAHLKAFIQRYEAEAVSQQKLNAISNEVVPATAIDDPLATVAPVLVGAEWNAGNLTLTLDRPVSGNWVQALQNMGNYSSVLGHGPETFRFQGNRAIVDVDANTAQSVINHFKNWLPTATNVLRHRLEQEAQRAEAQRRERLRREREAEELRLRVNGNLKI